MGDHFRELSSALDRVRRRWFALALLGASARVAAALTVALTIAALVWFFATPVGIGVVVFGIWLLVAATVATLWGAWPLRRRPSNRQVARFVEERCPELEDRVASAAELLSADWSRPGPAGPLVQPMLADAAARLGEVDPERLISRRSLQRAAVLAVAASLVCAVVLGMLLGPLGTVYRVASAYLLPSRISIDVEPGHARLVAGAELRIRARVRGARGLVPVLVVGDGDIRQTRPMQREPDGDFTFVLERVTRPFSYAVAVAATESSWYDVTLMDRVRIRRVELRYEYPPALAQPPRVERDGGDIIAPVGTRVGLTVHTDKPLASGAVVLDDGRRLPLGGAVPQALEGQLAVKEDGSYRLALVDADGLPGEGDTEYYIRVLDDRPPDVRIVEPAADRGVTPLEEVVMRASAEDDFGLDRLEIVYSVGGQSERTMRLPIRRGTTSAEAEATLYLEELDVKPGDFVTYYARARDVSRAARSSEARSDIFFLEVRPFEEEFVAAASQAMGGGGGGHRSIDELVRAQKDVIVATWKLDRRARLSGGRAADDIAAVARAQAALRERLERMAGGAPSAARVPGPGLRQVTQGSGLAAPGLAGATAAMSRAERALSASNTAAAIPHEMAALNELLRAQAAIKRHQVMRSSGGGSGQPSTGRADLSELFDRELQREQQTNYEMPTRSGSEHSEREATELDRLRELARRQDELARRQRDLADRSEGLTEEELKRQLDRLTREQSDLRRETEQLSREIGRQAGNRSQAGQPGRAGASGQNQGQGQAQGSAGGERSLREASEAMGSAAAGLRRQDLAEAARRGAEALERLRDVERQARGRDPGERNRMLGDLQLEAREMAGEQRRIADRAAAAGRQPLSPDEQRRIAGDKARLAGRLEGLERRVQELGAGAAAGGREQAMRRLAEEVRRERLSERMRQTAEFWRADGAAGASARAEAERALARSLERMAGQLGAAVGLGDTEAARLSEQLRRTQEVRDRLADVSRRLEGLERSSEAGKQAGRPQGQGAPGSQARPPAASSAGNQAGQATGTSGGGAGGERERLREEFGRELQEAQRLVDEARQAGRAGRQGQRGPGLTPEGQGRVLSAPGTEAFKQDFSAWDELRQQVSLALEQLEAALSERLHARLTREKPQAARDEQAPEQYRRMVDEYYRSIARKQDRD